MIRKLWAILYGSTSAEFRSDYGLEDSIARLRAATQRSVLRSLSGPAAVGRVTNSKVRLQRVIPMLRNSFKPFFIGRFEARDDGIYLAGRFSMLLFVKAFMTIWLGMCLAFAILPVILSYRTQRTPWWFSLAAVGMFGVGLALVALGQWFARNDVSWLAELIRSALTKSAVAPSTRSATARAIQMSARPTVLTITAAVLLLMGLMGLLSAATGISSYQASPNHVTITRFSSWASREAAGVYALVTIFLAVGIYHQKHWAWRFGLAYLGAIWLYTISEMFGFSQIPAAIKIVFSVLSFGVAVYWGLWWYAQRVHFHDTEC